MTTPVFSTCGRQRPLSKASPTTISSQVGPSSKSSATFTKRSGCSINPTKKDGLGALALSASYFCCPYPPYIATPPPVQTTGLNAQLRQRPSSLSRDG